MACNHHYWYKFTMSTASQTHTSAPIWEVPLQLRPQLLDMGHNTHGVLKPVESYQMLSFWSLHFYKYAADFWINGQHASIRPGTISLVPPNTDLRYAWRGRSQHLCAHFTFSEHKASGFIGMRAVADISPSFKELYRRFDDALGWFATERRRAEVRLWDLLWELAELHSAERSHGEHSDPAKKVRQMIERGLSEPLRVADLAEEAGISHNHLTRLFRSAYGTTVAGFIRRRRVERAQYLLAHSTVPVKSIAIEVGIPDLHLFNKTIRAVLGCSPREVRKRERR